MHQARGDLAPQHPPHGLCQSGHALGGSQQQQQQWQWQQENQWQQQQQRRQVEEEESLWLHSQWEQQPPQPPHQPPQQHHQRPLQPRGHFDPLASALAPEAGTRHALGPSTAPAPVEETAQQQHTPAEVLAFLLKGLHPPADTTQAHGRPGAAPPPMPTTLPPAAPPTSVAVAGVGDVGLLPSSVDASDAVGEPSEAVAAPAPTYTAALAPAPPATLAPTTAVAAAKERPTYMAPPGAAPPTAAPPGGRRGASGFVPPRPTATSEGTWPGTSSGLGAALGARSGRAAAATQARLAALASQPRGSTPACAPQSLGAPRGGAHARYAAGGGGSGGGGSGGGGRGASIGGGGSGNGCNGGIGSGGRGVAFGGGRVVGACVGGGGPLRLPAPSEGRHAIEASIAHASATTPMLLSYPSLPAYQAAMSAALHGQLNLMLADLGARFYAVAAQAPARIHAAGLGYYPEAELIVTGDRGGRSGKGGKGGGRGGKGGGRGGKGGGRGGRGGRGGSEDEIDDDSGGEAESERKLYVKLHGTRGALPPRRLHPQHGRPPQSATAHPPHPHRPRGGRLSGLSHDGLAYVCTHAAAAAAAAPSPRARVATA